MLDSYARLEDSLFINKSAKMTEKKRQAKKTSGGHPKYNPVSLALSPSVIDRLDAAAERLNLSRSDMARQAITYWLDDFEKDQLTEPQTKLLREIRSVRALIVKSIMMSAQATYFTAMPIAKGGFPGSKPPQKYMDALWNASMKFASDQVRNPLAKGPTIAKDTKPKANEK